jgi:methionyl-tRNA formyltransferase
LLKKDALELAKFHPINAHGSLLPKYRGAAPIQAALLSGDAESGVCIMKMELGLDTGPVLLERRIPISADETAGTLHDKLADLSAQCFVDAVGKITAGPVAFIPQDETRASYAGKLSKDSGAIDWSKDAANIERLIRAMTPWPGTWTRVALPDGSQPQRLRIAKASLLDASGVPATGRADAEAFIVATHQGALRVTQIQPEGKREMSAAEFLRGAGKKYSGETKWF